MEGQKQAFNPSAAMQSISEDSGSSPAAGTPSRKSTTSRNMAAWMRRSSLILPDTTVTWELVIGNIIQSITALNQSIAESKKDELIDNTNRVVGAIRDMMVASGTMAKDSPALSNNASLRAFHNHIMTSLSKLVITSKVASGQWPPPDAVETLRYHVGQVLLAVRNFVAQAQQMSLELSAKAVGQGIVFDFALKGVEMSDQELVTKLDEYSDTIFKSIGKLVGMIQKSNRVSGSMIDQARSTVTYIGELMSLIEDIKIVDTDVTKPEILEQFNALKEQTYSAVNGLITSAMSTMDEFAPSNSLNSVLEFTSHVFEAVEDLVMTTKLLLDQMELQEQMTLQDKTDLQANTKRDSELSLLKRRAMSLTLLPIKETRNAAGKARAMTMEAVPKGDPAPILSQSQAMSLDLSVRRPSAVSSISQERQRTYSGGSIGADGQMYMGSPKPGSAVGTAGTVVQGAVGATAVATGTTGKSPNK
jgi:hypothetical protein